MAAEENVYMAKLAEQVRLAARMTASIPPPPFHPPPDLHRFVPSSR